jgi:hypothetical protein
MSLERVVEKLTAAATARRAEKPSDVRPVSLAAAGPPFARRCDEWAREIINEL